MISGTPLYKGAAPSGKKQNGGKNCPLRRTPYYTDCFDCPPERTPGSNGLTRNPTVVKRWFYVNIIRLETCVRILYVRCFCFRSRAIVELRYHAISKCVCVLCSEMLQQCLPKKRKELGRVLFIKSWESNGNTACVIPHNLFYSNLPTSLIE